MIKPHDQSGTENLRSSSLEKHYQQVYSGEAKDYDNSRFSKPKDQRFNAAEQARIAELLCIRPGQSLLDVAGGTGRIAIPLAKQNVQVTVLDMTHAMMLQAQARAGAMSPGAIKFVEGNARRLPFANQQFDSVIAIRFFHLFPVALHRTLILEMVRVLRTNGVLLVQFNSALAGGIVLPWSRKIFRRLGHKDNLSFMTWPDQISQVFAGFENVTIHGFWAPGGYLLGQLSAKCANEWERWLEKGWRSYLSWHIFVRLVKSADQVPV